MRRVILFLPAFFSLLANAQSVSTTIGARAMGLGNASSVLQDEWALLNNTGGLGQIREWSSAFSYEIHPSLPGSVRIGATGNFPTKFGTAGISVFRFGDQLYNEQVLSAGYGNHFGIASLGISVNYIQYRAEGYGTKNAFGLNFGGIAQLTPQLTVGAYATNLNQPKISSQDSERVPTRLAAGLSVKPAGNILLIAEVDKDVDHKPVWKGAVECKIHSKIFARTGFNLQPNAAFFGLGFQSWRIKIDYAIQYSSALRYAHQGSLFYRLQKQPAPSK